MLKELTKSRSSIKKSNNGQINSYRQDTTKDNLQQSIYLNENTKTIPKSQSEYKVSERGGKENSSFNERTIDTTIKSNTIKQRLNNFISDVKSQSRAKSSAGTKGNKSLSPTKDILSKGNDKEDRPTNIYYTKNVSKLESWIDEIKTKGFMKLRGEIEAKQSEIKKLEISVSNLQRDVNYYNGQRKHYCTKQGKLVSEIAQFEEFGDRFRREVYYMQKEMPSLRKEIPELKEDFSNITQETRLVKQIIIDEQKQIDSLKDEIARMNKSISDVLKEKENLRNGINLLKKHTEVLNDKIQYEDKKSKDFMQNVSTLMNSTLR